MTSRRCPSCGPGRGNCFIINNGVRPVKPSYLHEIRANFWAVALGAGIIVLAAADDGAAGPWTRARGGHYTKLALSYLYTETEFDHRGDEVPVLTSNPLVQSAAYREVGLSAYVEYGLTDRTSLVGSLPFKILTSRRTEISSLADLIRDVDVTNAGLGDLSIGARRGLVAGRRPVAVELLAKLPLGYEVNPDNSGPALGSGEPDLTASAMAGLTLRGAYLTATAAYRIRGGPLANDAGFAAQIGGSHRGVSGQVLLEGWYSTRSPEPLGVSSTMAVPNQDLLKLIASLGFRTAPGAEIVVEAYHALQGKNAAAGTTAALALVLWR